MRPYQLKAKEAIFAEWNKGVKKTLLVLPTGTGKTIVFAALTSDIVRQGGRVLILAHREELLQQAADKLAAFTGLGCAVEKAESTAIDTWYNVVVGSVQTLQREGRRARFDPDHFAAIIVDEAHHALSPSYLSVLNHFPDANVLGVTATADRGDKRNLGEYFDSMAYEYGLHQAVRDGWLVRPSALTLPVKIDLSGVKVTAGDFNSAALGHALDPYLADIADQMVLHCQDRKSVVFLPLIATSQKFEGLLRERGMKVKEINGESKDRKEKLKWFNDSPNGAVLCNSMLLTEGWDEPSASCIVCLRPTKIRSLYAQIIGRGARLYPGKKDLLILDFLWHTDRHDLMRPASLICQNPDIAQRVSEIMAEESEGEVKDLLDMEAGAESKAQEEREESLRKMLDEQRHRQRKLVDPLQYEASISAGKLDEYLPEEGDLHALAPPTQRQLDAIEKAGIFPAGVTCQGHATRILDTIRLRRANNLSTPKQIRFLERNGFQSVGTWDFDSARKMIDRFAANMWRCPRGVDPSSYAPAAPPPPPVFEPAPVVNEPREFVLF